MLVLGIESTCDETACAIVRDGKDILSNVVSSQIDLHREFGGVVPELACRRHVDILIPVIDEALKTAGIALKDIDLIAVAHGPGLIGALLLGLNTAKALSLALNKPFIGVNHIEAHLYAAMMSQTESISFPTLGVVLSGGHTSLVLINSIGSYTLLGQTIDDAIGEAFDKVARILGLPYPGGPEIEALAKLGNASAYPLKPGKVKERPFDFSFSGLKTAALYTLRDHGSSPTIKQDLSASFQKAALTDVINKTLLAADKFDCKTIIFGGGVTNNQTLRTLFQKTNQNLNYIWPASGLSLDNAAMIAGLGYHRYNQKGSGDTLDLQALTSISF